jgi:hypothetical protein
VKFDEFADAGVAAGAAVAGPSGHFHILHGAQAQRNDGVRNGFLGDREAAANDSVRAPGTGARARIGADSGIHWERRHWMKQAGAN